MGNKKDGTGKFDTLGIQAPLPADLIPPPEKSFAEKLSSTQGHQISSDEGRRRQALATATVLKNAPPHGRPGKHRF